MHLKSYACDACTRFGLKTNFVQRLIERTVPYQEFKIQIKLI